MARNSKQFSTEFKPDGLAERKKKIHTQKELRYIKSILKGKKKILDVGCGYGRFTIPLAKFGFEIEGIDITPSLIKKAKEDSKEEGVNITFRVGDMRNLPYKNESFDAIICMWSVFVELTKESDQLKSVKEMLRVLKKEGIALIEMPKPEKMTKDIVDLKSDVSFKKSENKDIVFTTISGIEAIPLFRHNKKTLTDLMKKTKAKKFKVFVDDFGGRERLFLQFWK
jgi:ubiquinone/menaquinone biosynthesis C-methylase UbiE